MLKILTGPPRSGKSFFAVRHILLTYFKWNPELFEWEPKEGKIPFILTNIDGLLVPHAEMSAFLKEQGCTLPEFLTLEKIVPFIEKEGRPFVLLLDEAHGTFPYNFKDRLSDQPQKSVFYFFGYHGHYPIDLYLISQSWNDLNPTITGKAEFQIDAERRTTSMIGEFKYNYLHPKTMEVMNTQIIKPGPENKKIFMAYKSSSGGEYKTNEVRPYRKYIYLALFLIVLIPVLLWRLSSLYQHDDVQPSKVSSSRPSVGASMPGRIETKKQSSPVPAAPSISAVKRPESEPNSYVTVSLGGAWVGRRALAVDLFGDMVMLRDLPYSYTVNYSDRRIYVNLPDTVVGAMRPGLWLDSARIVAIDEYEEPDEYDYGKAHDDFVRNDKPDKIIGPSLPK